MNPEIKNQLHPHNYEIDLTCFAHHYKSTSFKTIPQVRDHHESSVLFDSILFGKLQRENIPEM